MLNVRIDLEDFDPGAELAGLGRHGAVASFIGHVRADDGVETLFLEHHPAMAKMALTTVAEGAMTRWPLAAVTLVHRVGALRAGDRIVLVGCASDHRAAALAACAFCIDQLKTSVPFWKKELRSDGSASWVDQRSDDVERAGSWD